MPSLLIAQLALAAGERGLGRMPTPEEIKGWDIDVRADGTGLPDGQGTVVKGEKIYVKQCRACHGDKGVFPAVPLTPPLAGGRGSLESFRPRKTIGSFWPYAPTLFDYVRRAMPYGNPGSLSDTETYSVTAYLLFLNHLLPRDAVLDASYLAGIKMPNRNGFVPDPRPDAQ
jgi:cytochrome c